MSLGACIPIMAKISKFWCIEKFYSLPQNMVLGVAQSQKQTPWYITFKVWIKDTRKVEIEFFISTLFKVSAPPKLIEYRILANCTIKFCFRRCLNNELDLQNPLPRTHPPRELVWDPKILKMFLLRSYWVIPDF